MVKGKPFLEILASCLNEEYQFPILEILVFIFAIGTFVFSYHGGLGRPDVMSPEALAFGQISVLSQLNLLQILIILKNIAYSLGSDLEKGVIQTYLSYPLKRRSLLTAKLLSSIGVPLLLLLGIQMFALSLLSPDVLSSHFGMSVLTYLGAFSFPLLVIGFAFLLTLILKKGGIGLVAGILLYFMSLLLLIFIGRVVAFSDSDLLLKLEAVLRPDLAMRYHVTDEVLWSPSFVEASLYVVAGYSLVIPVFAVGYLYFERRLEV
jgi:ABC-type transport system involved in multi-copper enzyme maturation permease subunit